MSKDNPSSATDNGTTASLSPSSSQADVSRGFRRVQRRWCDEDDDDDLEEVCSGSLIPAQLSELHLADVSTSSSVTASNSSSRERHGEDIQPEIQHKVWGSHDNLPLTAFHAALTGHSDGFQLSQSSSQDASRASADEDLPSIGSALHFTNECKPCTFFNGSRGCNQGEDCSFCHMNHYKAKRPSKSKRNTLQKKANAIEGLSYEQMVTLADELAIHEGTYMQNLLLRKMRAQGGEGAEQLPNPSGSGHTDSAAVASQPSAQPKEASSSASSGRTSRPPRSGRISL
eukprot:gnl/TRDRNA2_/TRDRNA2_89474_c0_seq1.p1 gnl/TRDRNA2_/TRDRNA2_89474_c0~~gnl/TRDRNA2_/TRDRNA2_89474_c0_seq1.p1  ORF type:complete len:286 (+),score=22.97 gnl/TRDRNA2_/TRDRNA2_89474_c0_seq1:114-971(+)